MQRVAGLRADARAIWNAGVAAVDARKLVRDLVSFSGDRLNLGCQSFPISEIGKIVVVGFGKATGAMAIGFEQALGGGRLDSSLIEGQVNVPDDQTVETSFIRVVGCRPPGENLPTERVVQSTRKIMEYVRSSGPRDILVCLISGGGSALLEQPRDPITLEQLRETTTFLSNSGASIYELNKVRTAISMVKGGRLAMASGGAPVISLIVSDVIGDDLDVIASGPTVLPRPVEGLNRSIQAIEVLKKYDPKRTNIPVEIWTVLQSGVVDSDLLSEMGRQGPENVTESLIASALAGVELDQPVEEPIGPIVTNLVIGNVETAMVAAQRKAMQLGYEVELSRPSGNEGDAEAIGRAIAHQLRQMPKESKQYCQIMGGESTVAVCDDPGRGGRNQHLVLSAIASILENQPGPGLEYSVLSGGTDGEDGNVAVAGAGFDSSWVKSLGGSRRTDLLDKARSSLSQFDSHCFLSREGLLLDVPRTFTNVCDLRIVLSRSD